MVLYLGKCLLCVVLIVRHRIKMYFQSKRKFYSEGYWSDSFCYLKWSKITFRKVLILSFRHWSLSIWLRLYIHLVSSFKKYPVFVGQLGLSFYFELLLSFLVILSILISGNCRCVNNLQFRRTNDVLRNGRRWMTIIYLEWGKSYSTMKGVIVPTAHKRIYAM